MFKRQPLLVPEGHGVQQNEGTLRYFAHIIHAQTATSVQQPKLPAREAISPFEH